MERNQGAIDAARETLRTVSDAVDRIVMKATQLESLLVLLAHTSASHDLPAQHRENACWLASELVAAIRAAAGDIG